MIPTIQQAILERLAKICDLSPDVRFGQMMAMMGVLAEDFSDQSVWDVEDETLLAVLDQHLADLMARGSAAQQPVLTDGTKATGSRPTTPVLKS